MKKNRFRQMALVLLVLAAAACLGFWPSDDPEDAPPPAAAFDKAGAVASLPKRFPVSVAPFGLPPAKLSLAHMGAAQKQQVAEQARKDAEAAALSAGQPQALAAEAGEMAAAAALAAAARPSALDYVP